MKILALVKVLAEIEYFLPTEDSGNDGEAVLIEAGRVNVAFEFRERGVGKIFDASVFTKEIGGDDIDAGVGALRGEDDRDQKF